MRSLAHLLCFIMLSALVTPESLLAQTPSSSKKANQTAQSLPLKNSKDKLNYWLFLPVGYDTKNSTKKWPLMIFLHGHGERGSDLAQVKMWGPPKRVVTQPDFPFVLVSPQLPDKFHSWQTDSLKELVNHSIDSLNVDPDRVYLTGLSMGGRGSWALAAEMPEQFAAVLPICGGGKLDTAKVLVDVPIWAFHGDADRVVPVSETTEMVKAIKNKGGNKVKMTIYPKVRHNSWKQTYANPEIYKWLLQHKRKQ